MAMKMFEIILSHGLKSTTKIGKLQKSKLNDGYG